MSGTHRSYALLCPKPSLNHLISTGHPTTSRVAGDLLEAGGNAFDAVVGAAFTSCVTEPLLIGLGGGGFALVRTHAGEAALVDFFADIPGRGTDRKPAELDFYPVTVRFGSADQIFHVGHGSVAVPGLLKGLVHLHERLGRLPLEDVVAPAARVAREGVRINAAQAHVAVLLEPIVRTAEATGTDHLAPDGRLLGEGDLYRTPQLADFLERLPDDPDGLYTGAAGRVLAETMRSSGGLVTSEDLAAYRVIEREPLTVPYRDALLLTNPAPSLGGPLIGLALMLQEAVELGEAGWGSARHTSTLAAVLEQVDLFREAGRIPGLHDEDLPDALRSVRSSVQGTTHLSIADAEGNVVALTGSTGSGSGVYAPGTGIMLNNMLGEDDLHPDGFHTGEVGRRISSMMSPTILLRAGGRPIAMGSGGSKRIRTAIHQVVTNLVDFDLPLHEAVNRPRLHRTEGSLQIEPGFPPEALAALADRRTVLWEDTNLFFGGVHSVSIESGEAAGDHRRSGAPLVVAGR